MADVRTARERLHREGTGAWVAEATGWASALLMVRYCYRGWWTLPSDQAHGCIMRRDQPCCSWNCGENHWHACYTQCRTSKSLNRVLRPCFFSAEESLPGGISRSAETFRFCFQKSAKLFNTLEFSKRYAGLERSSLLGGTMRICPQETVVSTANQV